MMTKPLLAILLLTTTLSASAEDLKSWRCVTKNTIGAKLTDGNIRPVNFDDRSEYRLMPAEDVLSLFTQDWQVQRFNQWMSAVPSDDGHAFLRDVSSDPKEEFSWSICTLDNVEASDGTGKFFDSKHPAYTRATCKPSILGVNAHFRMNTFTKRFVAHQPGDWDQAWGPQTDAYFQFGTCTPYYD